MNTSPIIHTFAGNPMDRGEALRRSEEQIAALQNDDNARFLIFRKLKVASPTAPASDAKGAQLQWFSQTQRQLIPIEQVIFLGMYNNQPHFAASLDVKEAEKEAEKDANLEARKEGVQNSPQGSEKAESSPLQDSTFIDCRQIAATITTAETGILAQARAQLDWHARNPYCAQCGTATYAQRGGQIRRCDQCEKHLFPRTDAVAIMLIVDEPNGERCLLGRPQGPIARTNFYTALAGFIDQGESIEEAVRREVREEAGLPVGHVQYHSSQPWPFPSQLMIGCHGIALDQEINFDEVEMSDVRWFTRQQALAALSENDDNIRVPGKMAIAHHLIRAWAEGEVVL